jgi:hypothetical protein
MQLKQDISKRLMTAIFLIVFWFLCILILQGKRLDSYAQGWIRKNGLLKIQKQDRMWSEETSSDWWGAGGTVSNVYFARVVVIKTACKLIWCSYRNKTNLKKNTFCLFRYFYSMEKYIRATGFLIIFHSRGFLNVDVVSIEACFSAATQRDQNN